MDQNQDEFKVLSRSDFIKMARDNCTKNINPIDSDKRFTGYSSTESSAKRFLTRCIYALVILVLVIVLDQINNRFQVGSDLNIETWVTSNQSIKDAEDFFVSLYEKFAKDE